MSKNKNISQEKAGGRTNKPWPVDCPWPQPLNEDYGYWSAEDAEMLPLDEEAQDLQDIKDYMDELVENGRLNEDYSLNKDYELEWDVWPEDPDDADAEDDLDKDEWEPELGIDYWDEGFNIEAWEEDMSAHLNLLKLTLPSPVGDIEEIIGYQFINENLLRQAFTRRAFGLEYGVGDSERLEFIGDTVLNTVVTREMARQMIEVDCITPSGPFTSVYSEGDLTKVRSYYVCKEYLSARASELGLDQYILYGTGEEANESSREDMMEALIGAVAADCDWNWSVLETVVDNLLTIQLSKANSILKPSFYDLFNSWHQKHFHCMPEYEVDIHYSARVGQKGYGYTCVLRYFIPENDKGIWTSQRVDVKEETRSQAREKAAEEAYCFVVDNGLWMRLSDAGIIPDLENAINQLQELYQKKYVEQAVYDFEERKDLFGMDEWFCSCCCSGIEGWGKAAGKTKAKKKAAFMVLVRLMKSAGICKREWEKAMWEMIGYV